VIKKKYNSMLDLVWIIPEILGEFFINMGIPVFLIMNLPEVGIYSFQGMVSMGLSLLLVKDYDGKGFIELGRIKRRKKR